MTYSIVARDPDSGQIGVAVQSHWFCVGPLVAWAEPGVGAVATQSFVEASYGPLGLDAMRSGRGAPEALAALLDGDRDRARRQVAMVDSTGDVAAHTGEGCVAFAGERQGEQCSAQANMMARPTVWDAMIEAFEAARGDLAGRLVSALEAAEGEGGDVRGRQSAAIVVVAASASSTPWLDRHVDLRVDDGPDPVAELRRLLELGSAYEHMNRGDELVLRGELEAALAAYAAADESAEHNIEMTFWRGALLLGAGQVEQGRALVARACAVRPGLRELLDRLPAAGLLPEDPVLVRGL